MRCAWVSLRWLFFLDWALPGVKRTKRRLKEAERLNEVSPSHLSFLKNPTEAAGKIHSANTEVIFFEMWKLKCGRWISLGNPPWWATWGWLIIVNGGLACAWAWVSPLWLVSSGMSRWCNHQKGFHRDILTWWRLVCLRASLMKCSVPFSRNGFVNIRHKCQQVMIYISATAPCAHQLVGSDRVWLKSAPFQFHFTDNALSKVIW